MSHCIVWDFEGNFHSRAALSSPFYFCAFRVPSGKREGRQPTAARWKDRGTPSCRRLTGAKPRIEREFFKKAPEHPWLTPMPSPVSRFPITKATKGKLQGRCRVRARRGGQANQAPPRHTMTVVGCMWSPLTGHDWPLRCTSAFPVLGRRREAGTGGLQVRQVALRSRSGGKKPWEGVAASCPRFDGLADNPIFFCSSNDSE